MVFFDNLSDKFDDVKREAKRQAKKSAKKIKKETNSSSVMEAVAKKAGKSLDYVVDKVNEGVDEGYCEAMNYDAIRICIKLAQTNPVTSPMIYTGYTRALQEKIFEYGNTEYFYDDARCAIRGYKYERQALLQIQKVLGIR